MTPLSSEALAFSSDGRLLAVSSGLGGSKHIHLWDLGNTRNPRYVSHKVWLRSLKDKDTVSCLEFRPAARPYKRTPKSAAHTLASGGHGGGITIWDTTKSTASYRWQCGASPVAALLYSADGALLASASKDGRVQLWRVEDRYSFIVQLDLASGIGPAPRLVGGTRGVPAVWMWTPFEAALGLSGFNEKLEKKAIDGNEGISGGSKDAGLPLVPHLAAASLDDASIYTVETAVCVSPAAESCSTLVERTDAASEAFALGDGRALCVYNGKTWRIWHGVGATARAVDISPSGTLIVYVPEDAGPNVVAHIDALHADGSTETKFALHRQLYNPKAVAALKFSPDGRETRLVVSWEDHSVSVWNVTTWQWNAYMKLFMRPIKGLALGFTPCAGYMVMLEKERKKAALERIVSEVIPVRSPRDALIHGIY